MIFVSYIGEEGEQKEVFVFSDKSLSEVKKFTAKDPLYIKKNTGTLGIYYTKKESAYRLSHRFKKFNANGNYSNDSYITNELILGLQDSGIPYVVMDYFEWVHLCSNREIGKKSSSNLDDINTAVEKFLQEKYNPPHLNREYTHSSLKVRADFFAVTESRKVITVEVKSDKDTMARLEKQLNGYLAFSHIVYIATDEKHISAVERLLNSQSSLQNVGLLVFSDGEIIEEKKPYSSTSIDATTLLWKEEIENMLSSFKIKKRLSATVLMDISMNIFSVLEFKNICECLFVNRYLNESRKKDIKDMYKYREHKQEIIDSYFSTRN